MRASAWGREVPIHWLSIQCFIDNIRTTAPILLRHRGRLAQVEERSLCKREVLGSIPRSSNVAEIALFWSITSFLRNSDEIIILIITISIDGASKRRLLYSSSDVDFNITIEDTDRALFVDLFKLKKAKVWSVNKNTVVSEIFTFSEKMINASTLAALISTVCATATFQSYLWMHDWDMRT